MSQENSVPLHAYHEQYDENRGPGGRLLAFYGTLLHAATRREVGLADDDLEHLRECTLQGTLYDLGEYPGIVSGNGAVKGQLFRINDSRDLAAASRIFATLDAHEGFVAGRADSLYVRRCVSLVDPPVACWVYCYNWPVEGQPVIAGGDWLAHRP